MPTEGELRQAYRALTRRRSAGECPSATSLTLMARGELDGPGREEVLGHVADCADCAEELRLALEVARWSGARDPTAPSAATRRRFALPHGLAAGLALVSVGLGAWSLRLHQDNRRLRAEHASPRAVLLPPPARPTPPAEAHLNVAVVDLFPAEELRGQGSSDTPALLEAGSPAVLILNTTADRSRPATSLRIRNAAGVTVWKGSGLRAAEEDTLTLLVPAGMLAAGDYEVALLSGEGPGDGGEARETFRLRVAAGR